MRSGLGAAIGWAVASTRPQVAPFFGLTPPAFVRTINLVGPRDRGSRAAEVRAGESQRPLELWCGILDAGGGSGHSASRDPVAKLRHRSYSGLEEPGLPGHAVAPSSLRARGDTMRYRLLRRLRGSLRPPSVGGPDEPPRRTFRFADIARGWLVQDSDRKRLGTVVDSGEILLTVSRGPLSSTLYLPTIGGGRGPRRGGQAERDPLDGSRPRDGIGAVAVDQS